MESSCSTLLFFCLLGLSDSFIECCSNHSIVEKLTAAILSEYERELRPKEGANNSKTSVAVELDVRHGRVDAGAGIAIVLADLYMAWNDPRLSWNTTTWGIDSAYFSADSIWHPDISLLNTAQSTETDEPARVAVNSRGLTLWVPRTKMTAPCTLHLEEWPADEHVCVFTFGSKMYTEKDIDYSFSAIEKDDPEQDTLFGGEWTSRLVKSELISYNKEGDKYNAVRWSIKLQRTVGRGGVTSRYVTLAVLVLCVTSLLQPPADRAALHACAAVIAVIQLVACAAKVPPGVGVPRVISLYSGLLGVAALSVLWAALVTRLEALDRRFQWPLVRRLLRRTAAVTGFRENQGPEDSQETDSADSKCSDCRALATLLDLLFCALTLLVGLVLVCVYL